MKTAADRAASRQRSERRCMHSLLRLIAAVSIARTVLMEIVPAAGCAAWLVTAACLVPGLLLSAALSWFLRIRSIETLPDLADQAGGRFDSTVLSVTVALALLVDAARSMQALLFFFTEGIGSEGSPLSIALLTLAVLLMCLRQDGLPRAVFFLRRLMLAVLLIVAWGLAVSVRLDHLVPLTMPQGRGLLRLFHAQASLGWPLILPLMTPAPKRRSPAEALPVVCGCVVGALLLCLSMPDELLRTRSAPAAALLTPVFLQPAAMRMLACCLLMLAFFLTISGSVSIAANSLRPALRCRLPNLAQLLGALVCLTPLLPSVLDRAPHIAVWLAALLAGISLLLIALSIIRRRKERP